MLQENENILSDSRESEEVSFVGTSINSIKKAKKVLNFHFADLSLVDSEAKAQAAALTPKLERSNTKELNYTKSIQNIAEAYKLFISYKKSFEFGKRVFGFCNLSQNSYANDKTILSLASFFIHEKIVNESIVVGHSFSESFFSTLKSFSEVSKGIWSDGTISYLETSKLMSSKINKLISTSDNTKTIIFSSLQSSESEKYNIEDLETLRCLDSVTLIVDTNGSLKQLKKTERDLLDMGANLEGIILGPGEKK